MKYNVRGLKILESPGISQRPLFPGILVNLIKVLEKAWNFGTEVCLTKKLVYNRTLKVLENFWNFDTLEVYEPCHNSMLLVEYSDSPLNFRKGKVRPLDILEKDKSGRYIDAFIRMGEAEIIADTDMADVLSELVCRMYALTNTQDINEARYKKLLHMTGKYNQVNHFSCTSNKLNNKTVFHNKF